MSLTINSNSAAMTATRYLSANNTALGKSIGKLSSGYRVNSAADDPAGLVISKKLLAQVGGLGQAISNSNDAINMVKTAEGALNETQSLLLSMRNLAVHAANSGANDDAAVAADQLQINSAIDSLNRISANTQFGNKKLIDGTSGVSSTILDSTNVGSASFINGTAGGNVDVQVTTIAKQAVLKTADTTDYSAVTDTVNASGKIQINDKSITVAGTDKVQDVIDKINSSGAGVTATWDAANTQVVITDTSGYGTNHSFTYSEDASILNGGSGNNGRTTGQNAVATVTFGDGSTKSFASGTGLQLKDAGGDIINLTNAAGTAAATYAGVADVTSTKMTFQIGAYAGQTVDFALGSVAANQLGTSAVDLSGTGASSIAGINVTSQTGAQDAIKLIDAAISEVSTTRANLGAFQTNILESNVNSLSVAKENISASQSSISDTDMAAEMVNFTRDQILQQAGVSMLAQANQAPQSLLKLLG